MRQTIRSHEARDAARPVPDTAAVWPDAYGTAPGCRTRHGGPEGAAEGSLDARAMLLASQAGDAAAYARFLAWVAARVRARMEEGGASDAVVEDCLLRVHGARVTYHPSRCACRWADGVIDAALEAASVVRSRRRPVGNALLAPAARSAGGGAGSVSPR